MPRRKDCHPTPIEVARGCSVLPSFPELSACRIEGSEIWMAEKVPHLEGYKSSLGPLEGAFSYKYIYILSVAPLGGLSVWGLPKWVTNATPDGQQCPAVWLTSNHSVSSCQRPVSNDSDRFRQRIKNEKKKGPPATVFGLIYWLQLVQWLVHTTKNHWLKATCGCHLPVWPLLYWFKIHVSLRATMVVHDPDVPPQERCRQFDSLSIPSTFLHNCSTGT